MPSSVLTTLVKRVTADFYKTRTDSTDGTGPMTWRATRVSIASHGVKKQMLKTLCSNYAGPALMEEFYGWVNAAVDHHGLPLVFYGEDTEANPISKLCAFPDDTPLDVKAFSSDQLHAWWKTQQACDLACATVMSVLQSYIIAKHDLTVSTENGDYILVDVQRYQCAATMAFNGISWVANSANEFPDGIRSFVHPKTLSAPKSRNHSVLKLILEKPDGSKTHIWCDPSARQIFADMEIKEDGLHDVKFMQDSTFHASGKYTDLIKRKPIEFLDFDPFGDASVKFSAPYALCVFQQDVKKGYMLQRDVDRMVQGWKGLMDKHSQITIDWDAQHRAVMMDEAASAGQGMCLAFNPETGAMEAF